MVHGADVEYTVEGMPRIFSPIQIFRRVFRSELGKKNRVERQPLSAVIGQEKAEKLALFWRKQMLCLLRYVEESCRKIFSVEKIA